MVRSALRSAIGAGFMVAAMASASAQVLEIGADNGPTGLDPHLITAFPHSSYASAAREKLKQLEPEK